MKFERSKPTQKWSWAYRYFETQHTELNSLYWAHQGALRHAFAATRHCSPDDKATTLFAAPLAQRRQGISLKTWGTDYNHFDDWARLGLLVAATSSLEVYLRTIADAALQSCPALLVGGQHEIDGVRLLKRVPKYGYAEHASQCAKGTWDQRMTCYERLFGTVPAAVNARHAELEQLRRLRNAVGHAFGRDPNASTLAVPKIPPLRHLKEQQFLNYLSLVEDVAAAVDQHLASSFVGAYETIVFYHRWDKDYSPRCKKEAVAFVELLATNTEWAVGNEYADGLIKYYSAV